MRNRSGCNSGVNSSVMSHWGCDDRRRAMAYGLSQRGMMAGLSLKVVGSIERDPGLMAIAAPICVVGLPIECCNVDCIIILNKLLLKKVASIKLGVAKFITGQT